MLDKCRIDKWLWSVRFYKTRTIATEAVASGKVKVDNSNVKPSFMLSVGRIISIRSGIIKNEYKVLAIIDKRVGAKLAIQFFEDITSLDEKLKLENSKNYIFGERDKGFGRPTKKERRDLGDWLSED